MLHNRFAVIDFETTGFSPKNGDRCIEVALIIVEDGQITDRYHSLINSNVSIPHSITRLTGLDNSKLENAPPPRQVVTDLMKRTKGATLVAHNASFDSRFWRNEVKLALGEEDNQQFLCTMKLSRRLLPGRESYKLSELGVAFGYDEATAHHAHADTEVTVRLFQHLFDLTEQRYPEEQIDPDFLLKLQDTKIQDVANFRYSRVKTPAASHVGNNQALTTRYTTIPVVEEIINTPTTSADEVASSHTRILSNTDNLGSPLSAREILKHIDDENITLSGMETRHYKNGNVSSYRVKITHEELQTTRTVSSRHIDVLCSKVRQQVEKWQSRYQDLDATEDKHDTLHPDAYYDESSAVSSSSLNKILQATLAVNDVVDWDSLRQNPEFIFKGSHHGIISYDRTGKPLKPIFQYSHTPEPVLEELPRPEQKEFIEHISFWKKITFQGSRIRERYKQRYQHAMQDWKYRQQQQLNAYDAALLNWHDEIKTIDKNNSYIKIIFHDEQTKWATEKRRFDNEVNDLNLSVDNLQARYQLQDTDAIEEYCDLVLERSSYPEFWQRESEVHYHAEKKLVVVNFKLPEISELPKHKSTVAHNSDGQYFDKEEQVALYRSVIHQIMLRTLHEIFEADVVNAIHQICVNGYIVQETTPNSESQIFLTSINAEKNQFLQIRLHDINPTRCYDSLGGLGTFSTGSYREITPIVDISSTSDSPHEVSRNATLNEPNSQSPFFKAPDTRLPALNTPIDQIEITPEIDKVIRQIYNLAYAERGIKYVGYTLESLLSLPDKELSQIPSIGEKKIAQWLEIKSYLRNSTQTGEHEPYTHDKSQVSSEWQDAFDFADPEFLPLLQQYQDRGLAAPEIGLEVCDEHGAVTELVLPVAWPTQKFAIVSTEQEQSLANQLDWETLLVQTETTEV